MARKSEIRSATFKSLKTAGEVDAKMTLKAWNLEQDLIEELALLTTPVESVVEPVVFLPMVVEQLPEFIPQQPEVSLAVQAQLLLGMIDSTLSVIDSTAVHLQEEVRTHIPDVSTTPLKKSEMARNIFNREMDDAHDEERPMSRKTVIGLFMSVAGLSKNGAATYYQNIKREHGLIGS